MDGGAASPHPVPQVLWLLGVSIHDAGPLPPKITQPLTEEWGGAGPCRGVQPVTSGPGQQCPPVLNKPRQFWVPLGGTRPLWVGGQSLLVLGRSNGLGNPRRVSHCPSVHHPVWQNLEQQDICPGAGRRQKGGSLLVRRCSGHNSRWGCGLVGLRITAPHPSAAT